jgi:biopolymer transport protein ExbB
MIRLRGLALLLFTVSIAAMGAEPDLGASAAAARTTAEQTLAASRTRIAAEHADLLRRLHDAVTAQTTARDRLTTAQRDDSAAASELSKRIKEQDQHAALVRQWADRAVIAAKLGDGPTRALAAKPAPERVAAAIAGIDARIAALPARLAGEIRSESIVGRTGAVATVPVLRLGEARAVAVGTTDEHRGMLERAADGRSWLVVGPRLPSALAATSSVGMPSLIAVDATGRAAHHAGVAQRTVAEWIAAGRAFIWPIIAVFAIGVLIIIERMIALAKQRVDARRLMQVAEHLTNRDAAGALALISAGATSLDRVLRAGVTALGRPRESREAAVEQALLAEIAQLSRGLPAIAVLAGVAPLLGLLGTVTGMIDMFSVIAAQGSGNAKSLSGGISEALICTQAGMLVAIPLLLAHAWLGRVADRRSLILEEAACGVLGLSEHGDHAVATAAPVPA